MCTVTSYLPSGMSPRASRSMCTTNSSPTAETASPVASINIPDASMSTCPCGSRSTAKIAAGSAGMVRDTSMRSATPDTLPPGGRGRVSFLIRSTPGLSGGGFGNPQVDLDGDHLTYGASVLGLVVVVVLGVAVLV